MMPITEGPTPSILTFLDHNPRSKPQRACRFSLAVLADLPVLDLTPEVRLVAGEILLHGGMPAKAFVDAVHVAVAAAHGVDYLLTWNRTHIANPMLRGRIEAICRATGFEPPVICTPVEFMQE